MLGERECGKKHLRWKAVSAVAIMSSLLIFSGCDSEEVDYLTHELALNNQNTMSLNDLKQQLFSYDATPDDDGVIYMSEIVDGVEVATSRTRIEGYVPKRNVRGSDLNDLLRNNASRSIKEKLSNELYKIYSSGEDKDARVEVVVTFVDDLKLPFLEDYDYSVSIKDVKNINIQKRNNDAIDLLSRIRKLEIDEILEGFPEEHAPLEILGYDRISKFVNLAIRLEDVDYLLGREDVQHIELLHEYAEMDENKWDSSGQRSGDDIVDGRGLINSDTYYSNNSGRIAVLDSSVDTSHVLLSGRFGVIRDCVNGTSNYCTVGTNLDTTDRSGHGSSSASIVAGSNALGNTSRGVSNILMDSYKVYYWNETDQKNYADSMAYKRAMDAAQNMNDRTILGEVQLTSTTYTSVATKTDDFFDLGFATIAAAGNFGPDASTVRCPANAHKAIGVGAYYVYSPYNLYSGSGRGPTSDNRIKPDIIAPTYSRAADVKTSTTALRNFGGTSGATPYAAAAAGLLRNRIGGSSNYLPGYVYTSLINASTRTSTAQFNNTYGAGKLKLANCSRSYWGRVVVDQNVVSVPIDIGDYEYTALAVTLWWPEKYNDTHRDFQIIMRNYDCGAWSGYWSATNMGSVWQKTVLTNVCPDTWYIVINPKDTVDREQPIFYNITFWQDGHPQDF